MGALETFRSATEERLGEVAKPWVAGIRSLLEELTSRWELELGGTYETVPTVYKVRASRSGAVPVDLRITYPDAWFFEEVAALSHWDGQGAVALLDHDPRGAELLARPQPGTPLAQLKDEDEALSRAAAVLERLWIADPGGIATVVSEAQEWSRTMLGRHHLAGRPFERELAHEAVGAIRDLLASTPKGVLLHGDVSLANVVEAGDGLDLAIDPRPLVGEPEFDAGALLRDGAPALAADPKEGRDRVQHRFDVLRDRLGLDGVRLKSWALAVAVDQAIWDFELGAGAVGRQHAQVARLIRDLQV